MVLLFPVRYDRYWDPSASHFLSFDRVDWFYANGDMVNCGSLQIGRESCNGLLHFKSRLFRPAHPSIALLRKEYE